MATVSIGFDAIGLTPVAGEEGGSSTITTSPLDLSVEISFAEDIWTPQWTDVSAYVREVSWKRGRSDELSQAQAGTAVLKLDNSDGRFDPSNSGSPYNPWVKPLRPVRITGPNPDGSVLPRVLFHGFVEGFPVEWAGRDIDLTTVRCFDGLGLLARTSLPSMYKAMASTLGVNNEGGMSVLWPMDEGGLTYNDYVGSNDLTLSIAPRLADGLQPYDPGYALDMSRAVSADWSNGGVFLAFTTRPTDSDNYHALELTVRQTRTENDEGGLDFDIPTWVPIMALRYTPSGATDEWRLAAYIQNRPNNTSTLYWMVPPGDATNENEWYRPSIAAVTWNNAFANGLPLTITVNMGRLNEAVVTESALDTRILGATATAWINGQNTPVQVFQPKDNGGNISTTTEYDDLLDLLNYVEIWTDGGGSYEMFNHNGPAKNVELDNVGYVVSTQKLTGGPTQARHDALLRPGRNFRIDERLALWLDFAGYEGETNLAVSDLRLGETDPTGSTALGMIQGDAAGSAGFVWCTNRGVLNYREFLDVSGSVDATFSDDDAIPGFTYTNITIDQTDRDIVNTATVSTAFGRSLTVKDATSIGDYGQRGVTVDTKLRNIWDAEDLADWIVAQYKSPTLRVRSITTKPTSDTDHWAACLDLDVGHRIRVVFTTAAGNSIDDEYLIESVATKHTARSNTWTTTYTLSQAP